MMSAWSRRREGEGNSGSGWRETLRPAGKRAGSDIEIIEIRVDRRYGRRGGVGVWWFGGKRVGELCDD